MMCSWILPATEIRRAEDYDVLARREWRSSAQHSCVSRDFNNVKRREVVRGDGVHVVEDRAVGYRQQAPLFLGIKSDNVDLGRDCASYHECRFSTRSGHGRMLSLEGNCKFDHIRKNESATDVLVRSSFAG